MRWEAGVESIGEQCALSACADTVEEAKKAMVHGDVGAQTMEQGSRCT